MGSTDPPGLRRLCLIENSAGLDEWGSGSAVGPDLVLTCAHVVGPVQSVWHVTPYGGGRVSGKVIWRSDRLDAALIEVDGHAWDDGLFPLRFGELTGPADCVTYGYPIVRRTAGLHRHEGRAWTVMPTTGAETGRYLISTTAAVPRDRTPDPKTKLFRSPWAGLSGAALLGSDESVVLGLVIADPERYEASTTEVVRASALLREPLFARLVGAGEPVPWPPPEPEGALADGIVGHADEIRGLAGMRENLTRMPFVPPAEGADTHPRRLLSMLSDRTDDRGVLLVGAAGVGKTRTCFEVGTLAEQQGWTVLHVRAGEPGVTAEQLAASIGGASGDVLVIIDYLNECNELSLSALQARVLPDARRGGGRVALLASARTAWSERARFDADVSRLFRRITVDPDDDHSGRIRDTIVERLAPDAGRILGTARLAELCGTRPVIAILIAAELQASAERETLTAGSPTPRPGVLLEWLHRRLREDGLAVEGDDDLWTDRPPSDHLQAITAMVAATPQDERSLLGCAEAVLDDDVEQARHLLVLLRAMGWLVDSPQGVATVHDVVADHLLEQCLLRAGSGVVRGQVLDRILSSGLGRARNVGRCAGNLGRLIRELDATGRSGELERRYAEWLDGQAGRVGALMAEQVSEGASALTALVRGPAWRAVVSERWEELAGPWFERHGGTVAALRLLEYGLKSLSPQRRERLAGDALRTLGGRPPRLEEDHLLCTLLDGDDLGGTALPTTTKLAFRWLKRYGGGESASFLLMSLLRRRDLPPATLRRAGDRALAWLRVHGDSPAAGYVIRSLLERDGMPGECVSLAIELAYEHVAGAPEALRTSFLLASLIGHPAVPAERQDRLSEFAVAWLGSHGDAAEARFVINRLLRSEVVPARTTEEAAFAWLEHHADVFHARAVIVGLIEQAPRTSRRRAIDHAFRWLARHWDRLDASYVLQQLVKRRQTPEVVVYALDWLREHATEEVASYVLAPLLARDDLSEEEASAAVVSANRWLKPREDAFNARFVLEKLLKRQDAAGRGAEHAGIALRWLDEHRSELAAGFILEPLLRLRYLDEKTSRRIVSEAVTWFELHRTVRNASYVFMPLLGHPMLEPEQRITAAEAALAWIDANEEVKPTDIVGQLLREDDPLPEELRRAVADRAIVRCTKGKDLRWPLYYGSLDLSLDVAFAKLADHNADKEAVPVLRALLSRRDVVGEPLARVAAHTLGWLDGRTTNSTYGILLGGVVGRLAELTDEHFNAAAGHALTWLDGRAGQPYSQPLLVALLNDPRLTESHATRLMVHARTWLGTLGDDTRTDAQIEAVRAALDRRD
ncbi:serine protease [Actinomadura sp. 7K507]|uniref:serine protease n=1 Tax=Actinomadura sp. 7K507 TaxID=2530365 RepID=UPI00104A73D6|nr:serine protease [Actinomadura sp. 7K507]TDC85583.1 serine protease [Actinomadura sp. 7K507]